jgi:hypothetical protein
MNVQTKKEIRSLGPFWIAAFLLPIVPLLFYFAGDQHVGGQIWGLTGYVVGCALLACSSFSSEWNHQTMDLLLAQPMARRQIWRRKMGVLLPALLTLVPIIALGILASGGEVAKFFGNIFGLFWLVFPVVWALSAGPYFSLTMGNGLAAVVSTLGLPIGWFAIIALILPGGTDLGEATPNYMFCILGLPLLVMALAFYQMGRAHFLNLQTSGIRSIAIRLPDWLPWIGHSGAAAESRPHIKGSAWGKILAKEFRLHEVSFIIAGFMILISALLIAYHPIYVRTVPEPRDNQLIQNLVIVVVFICGLIIPITVGATTVAEERQMGVLDWHLTLPPSHRKQWLLKIVIAYAHCIVLGIVLPVVIGVGAVALLSPEGTVHSAMESLLKAARTAPVTPRIVMMFTLPIFAISGASLLMSTVAMFASSLARTSMRAVVLTMVTIIGIGVVCMMSNWHNFNEELFNQAYIGFASVGVHYVWFAAMIAVLMLGLILWMNYLNYRRLEPPIRPTIQIVIVSVAAAILIGIPFFVSLSMQFDSQRMEMGLSPRAYLAYRHNENPELVLKEVSAALDRPTNAHRAVSALYGYRDYPEAQAIMHRALTNSDPNVRISGMFLLADRLNNEPKDSEEYRQTLVEFEKMLKDPHPYVQFIVARNLASKGLDVEQCIAVFTNQVVDVKSSRNQRRSVVDALGSIGPKAKSAIPSLIRAYDMTTEFVEQNKMYNSVTNALSRIDPSALNQLKPVAEPETNAASSMRYGLPPTQKP